MEYIGTSGNTTIRGLLAGHLYMFRIFSYSILGQSEYSAVKYMTTSILQDSNYSSISGTIFKVVGPLVAVVVIVTVAVSIGLHIKRTRKGSGTVKEGNDERSSEEQGVQMTEDTYETLRGTNLESSGYDTLENEEVQDISTIDDRAVTDGNRGLGYVVFSVEIVSDALQQLPREDKRNWTSTKIDQGSRQFGIRETKDRLSRLHISPEATKITMANTLHSLKPSKQRHDILQMGMCTPRAVSHGRFNGLSIESTRRTREHFFAQKSAVTS
ncbi:hypothetical protein DPMN_008697 [Dreissena polymorpha]|uniref:Fibronectin type-III domain-containing protein n=1 Tax=Dreissena polymorpha TaxID=45954 RepID=A0A9D4MZA1_DREPO|nr:hypothetical protein DPMN_008697 [Dreissena polymorpha]